MSVLKIDNVCKTIKDQVILENISLELQSGDVYGLIGRNGSGKTMLLRSIAGLMKPTSGTITYNGKLLYKDLSFLPSIGIVIENIDLYPEFTGFDNLMMLSRVKGTIGKSEVENALKRVGLDPHDKRTVRKYSLGMRKKLSIAQAIMEMPDVILLDEPTSALDEQSVDDIRRIIKEEKERGALIIITSHNSDDISILCDKIYKMENGKIRGNP